MTRSVDIQPTSSLFICMLKHEVLFEVGKRVDEDLEQSFRREDELKQVLTGCKIVRDRVRSHAARVIELVSQGASEGSTRHEVALAVVSFMRDSVEVANEEVSNAEKALALQTGSTLALSLQVDKLKKSYDEEVKIARAKEASAAYAPVLEAKLERARAAAETLREKKKKASQ